MDDDYIERVFGSAGILAGHFPGYAPRPGQVALARAVDAAFARGENLLAEAPTGVGKSVAYGVPAAYHATQHGKRVVIATANIALQEQLTTKDLPLLQRLLPWPFRFALAKGRANYLCLDRFGDSRAEAILSKRGDPEEARRWDEVCTWADATETGDLSELTFEPAASLKQRFTVTSEECLGKSCDSYEDCHANRAYKAMGDAHVVVTNYHLLFAHVAVVRATEGEAGILPPFDLLVMDEGHKAADIARDFFGSRVTPGGLRWLGRLLAAGGKKSKNGPLDDIDPEFKARFNQTVDRFAELLRTIRRDPDYSARMREARPEAEWRPLTEQIQDIGARYLHVAASRPLKSARKTELVKLGVRCSAVALAVERAMTLAEPEAHVYFIEEEGLGDRARVALVSKPVDVAPVLRDELFNASGLPGKPTSAAVVSATLRTGSGAGAFAFVRGELGATPVPHTGELVADSPFDFYEQALLVIPDRMPDAGHPDFARTVAEVMAGLVERAQGRTLGLFTSYRNLNVAYERVEREFRGRYRVMRQGEAPRTQLIRAFREDVSSVLLGTESFWQGVDVPGDALSALLIDKLPFASPDNPVLDAVQERNPKGWFRDYSVPLAVIAFRQGFGRLIRSTSDRGVVVCCDRRLVDKGYGRTFLRAIPEVRLQRSLDAVGPWLAGGSLAAGTVPVPGDRSIISGTRRRSAAGGRG